MIYSIAIDGPAGSGKSTIAKKLAKDLEFTYVDTGAMYRAIAIWALENTPDINDEENISSHIDEVDIELDYKDGEQQVILNGENVTGRLRLESTGKAASAISKQRRVREKLVDIQQKTAKEQSVIMDGRDIGTKVLPKAFLKIFMTASPEVRAKRRFDELMIKGENCDYEEILRGVKERDHADETRAVSPLRPAEDAVILDTSDMTERQVMEKIRELFEEKKGGKK